MISRKMMARLALKPSMPRRGFSVLGPFVKLENSPETNDILIASGNDAATQEELLATIERQKIIHLFAAGKLNLFNSWMLQVHKYVVYLICLLLNLVSAKYFFQLEQTKQIYDKRKSSRKVQSITNKQQQLLAVLPMNVILLWGITHLARKKRLSVLRQLFFSPRRRAYIVEIFDTKMGKTKELILPVEQIKFSKENFSGSYYMTFNVPGEKKPRTVRSLGFWLNRKLIPLINEHYAAPSEEAGGKPADPPAEAK